MLNLYKLYLKRSAEAKYIYINKIIGKKKYWFEKYGFKFFYRYFKWRFILTHKPSLFHIEYKLTSLCTLKCKDCCHNTPYFKENLNPVSFETFKNEIDLLLKSVDRIYVLTLIGGESLLNKDLYKMVKYARSKKQILFVDITTNATIIPKETLINELKNKKDVFVWVSDYSSNKKLLPKLKQKELLDIFKKNNIKYIFSDFEENVTPNWIKPPVVCAEKINKKINITECRLSNCHTFAEGNIYLCPLQFYMKKSEKYNFLENEYVDVLNNDYKDTTNNILQYYTKTEFDFCKYCKQPKLDDFVKPAIQVGEE